jgi:hypothetical protein
MGGYGDGNRYLSSGASSEKQVSVVKSGPYVFASAVVSEARDCKVVGIIFLAAHVRGQDASHVRNQIAKQVSLLLSCIAQEAIIKGTRFLKEGSSSSGLCRNTTLIYGDLDCKASKRSCGGKLGVIGCFQGTHPSPLEGTLSTSSQA